KARPTTESETKTESLAEKSSTNESSQKKNANPNETKAEKESPEKESKAKSNRKTKEAGTTLVLRNLETGVQRSFPNVVRYEFSKFGDRLALVTSVRKTKASKDKTANQKESTSVDGVHVVDLDDLEFKTILSGQGEYKNLGFAEDGSILAFLSNRDDYESKTTSWSVYFWKSFQREASLIGKEKVEGVPGGWWISPNSNPTFSKDNRRLYFDTAPVPESVIKERTEAKKGSEKEEVAKKKEKPKAKLDLWHWQDPYLQPQQLLQAESEKRRSYRAVYNIRAEKLIQLANQKIPSVSIDYRSESNVAVAISNMKYRKMLSWDVPGFQDTYLINLDTGEPDLLIDKSKASGRLSPSGKYVTWFDAEQRKWFAISTSTDREPVEISKGIPYPLQNELHDTPSLPRAYGSAGWLKDDVGFLVYDRFDIWKLDPTGELAPICITNNEGRENKITYRYLRLDREQRALDPENEIYLSAFDTETKASGFSKLAFDSDDKSKTKLSSLIMLPERLSGLTKSRDTGNVMFTRSTFRMYPDIWSSTVDFKKIQRVSDANPQQDDYRWGTAELISWNATDGQELDGLLLKPDGFDPSKKYPLMVYFYERNSDNLHSYYTPAAGRSIICHSFYVSRGYVVFIPDIPYKTGEPGPSAANAILPGVENLVQQGFIDPQKVGMQGHSWGGYQTAYLVTQTDMFACAESGAPVSNMTSAYGGIRWSSGMSRMFQYERTQSRIGEDLWAARQKYIANSPVFYADKINTPLLILHNDKDGAVPWYQGIELFVALRRLEKPAWLLNYNGEPHWVMKPENRLDFAIRMQQFFDHYLLDAPEPEWMAYGVPGVDKGKKFGLELLEPKEDPKGQAEPVKIEPVVSDKN
ncbi:MAG: prolyl oligopeptidase family serine peptidase, partial [Planctomycetota bacterium]